MLSVVAGEKEKAIAIAECVGVNSLVDCAQKWHQKCPFGGAYLSGKTTRSRRRREYAHDEMRGCGGDPAELSASMQLVQLLDVFGGSTPC